VHNASGPPGTLAWAGSRTKIDAWWLAGDHLRAETINGRPNGRNEEHLVRWCGEKQEVQRIRDVQDRETGCINLDVREYFLENRISPSTKRFPAELETPLSVGSWKSYFQSEY
jgi:hypothetical protein